MIQAKFIGERHDLESSQVKRVAKQAQQAQSRQDPRHISWSKVAQNAAFKKDRDRTGQSPPRADRGAHDGPWWEVHGRASCTHGRACLCLSGFSPFFAALRFSCMFLLRFGFYNGDVSGLLSE